MAQTHVGGFSGQLYSKATAPTTSDLGRAPSTGDIWFDTTNNRLMVHNGTEYVGVPMTTSTSTSTTTTSTSTTTT